MTCVGDSSTNLMLSWSEPAVSSCRGQGESLAVLEYVLEVEDLRSITKNSSQTVLSTEYTVTDRGMGVGLLASSHCQLMYTIDTAGEAYLADEYCNTYSVYLGRSKSVMCPAYCCTVHALYRTWSAL